MGCVISCRPQLVASTFGALYCWGTSTIALRTCSPTRSGVQRRPSIPYSSCCRSIATTKRRQWTPRSISWSGRLLSTPTPHSRRPLDPLHLQLTPYRRWTCGTNWTPPSPAMLYRHRLPLTTLCRDRSCVNSWQLATLRADTFAQPKSTVPWATNRHKYPSVAAVTRRLLAVPATSVASERFF